MTKVLMMIEKDGAWVEENVRIGKMKVKQFKKAFKKINEIIQLLEKDESTSELIEYFWSMDQEKKGKGKAKAPAPVVDEDLQSKMFMDNVIGAFKIVLDKLPEEAFELISIISGIDEEVLDEQDYPVFFDILEAIITENDVKTIIDRLKDLFFTTRNKWGGLKAIKG